MTFGSLQHLAEKPFGGLRIPFCAEHKVDRLAGGIDRAIEVIPLPFDFDIGLINTVRVIGWAQMRAASFLQFGGISLNPPIDRRMIDCEVALLHHFFEVAITKGVAHIPAHAEKDDLGLMVSPFERIRFGQSSPQ